MPSAPRSSTALSFSPTSSSPPHAIMARICVARRLVHRVEVEAPEPEERDDRLVRIVVGVAEHDVEVLAHRDLGTVTAETLAVRGEDLELAGELRRTET